ILHKFELNKNQHSKNKLIKKIKPCPELMRLIGYFLAEGHITNRINQTGFTFHRKEKEYIADVKNILDNLTKRKISIRHPNPNSTQILIHSKEWATFFDNFCGKKGDKHIPSFSWQLPKELFIEMLKGYIRGDGYKVGKYGIVVKSVSKKLITEFIWLCKLNGISCNLSYEKNKAHKLPQGNWFKGSEVYLLRIPKSELPDLEFHRPRNKFSPHAGDKVFPTDGLKKIYYQIKPKIFKDHRLEHSTLKKRKANLKRIRNVLNWFDKFKSIEFNEDSKRIYSNYKKLFNSDISVVGVKEITQLGKEKVYDVSVEETESFFGNHYPLLLHNSGSKGFHLIVPWKAFPKEINGVKTTNMFPEYPRIITKYIIEKTKNQLVEAISGLNSPSKYIKDYKAPKEVMPDLILVSPRHLFRMPYSLHEKTALCSVVLKPHEIKDFDFKQADPLKVKIKEFMPNSIEGEASELLVQSLDWYRENNKEEVERKNQDFNFKQIKLTKLSEDHFPPCVRNILKGVSDGKKRAVFVLINLFRSIGMDREELEKRIYDWNKKNEVPLKEGYIKTQLAWSFRKKPIMPQNCKEFYQGIGVCTPDNFCSRVKNPVNYVIRRNLSENQSNKATKFKKKD
ncbi:MAG TPA: LAGLIDADG family homing endonuclease, partial [Candidatus Nanoarchaeia archaeon]|nr:LAGLIDADG family homing endonuclease [Candidatus Nanoarchaeia archaeon]